MHLHKYISAFIAFSLLYTVSNAQTTATETTQPEPKREFRGVWIATVVNLDWPQNARGTEESQKTDLIDQLNAHQRTGINAIMFQVRPAADAFYAKSREPWSKYLTGTQGKAPTYDPLEFAIEEAHKRNMELHAWFNPYRATFDGKFYTLAPNHITRTKPEWFFIYGGIKLFNPGLPEVREYIVQVILDVVKNYDVDGIHMDDYFYPYLIDGQKVNDQAAFEQYGEGFDNIKDWRRSNVDTLIKMLGDSIHKVKPRMKFGISPFGIWANKAQNEEGSETAGGSSYYENYADSRQWVQQGWIDYINPQIYWHIGYRLAAFEKLLDWWSNNTYNRHLYIGQGPYRYYEQRSPAYKNPSEIPNQIRLLRANPRVQGSVFFRSQTLVANANHLADTLKHNFYRYPALPPPMLWLDSIAPNAPQGIAAKYEGKAGITLKWQPPLLARDSEPVYGYIIYRFEENDKFEMNDPKNILSIQYNTIPIYQDTNVQRGKSYYYVVTAIDRLKNESDRSPTAAISTQ
ncbi:family 10 glycosylhydrolase [Inquilinus sp. KBS0705]|nr:family 10 glycosylhydrolase [Inquilinus sp. KBS0705]